MARAWLFGDDLDTDQIVPGRYAPFMVGQDKFHAYAFCDARPEFAKEVRPGDVLGGGENFGCGSSREYAVAALAKHGIGGIVAKSFARIFFRNCINLGIPALESTDALSLVHDGDDVTLVLQAGPPWQGAPPPPARGSPVTPPATRRLSPPRRKSRSPAHS